MGRKENVAIVRDFMARSHWHCEAEEREEVSVFAGTIGGFDGLYKAYRFMITVGDGEIQTYAFFPASAKGAIAQTAEFIARANRMLVFGGFILDCDTGEIRFHAAFPAQVIDNGGNPELRDASLRFLLFMPVQMMDAYAMGLNKVITGAASPADAFASCSVPLERG